MNARQAAVRCLLAVTQGSSLGTALPAIQQEVGAGERGFVQALVYATLRQRGSWRWLLAQLLAKPLQAKEVSRLEAVLGSALAELRGLSSPPHAVVHAAVDTVRALGLGSASTLVNAVLRRYLRERVNLESRLATLPQARMCHPDWLLARLRAAFGVDLDAVCNANLAQAPMWLRVHPRAGTAVDYASQLAAPAVTVPGLPAALRLTEAPDVSALPGFHDGHCSVQDLAAQHCAWLLAPRAGERVLDACAAPGGKTAHLLELGATDVLAIDADGSRLDKIRANLTRLQLNAKVRQSDASKPAGWWDGEPFDAILLDAPCSATGVIRRHPDILTLRREQDLAVLAAAQSALLAALWTVLKPGGRLLYATCSVLPEENEGVVVPFLTAHPEATERHWHSPVPEAFALRRPVGRLNVPGAAGADGFYIAMIEKAAHTGL